MEASYSKIFQIGKYFLAKQYNPEVRPWKLWYLFIGKEGKGYYSEVIRLWVVG